MRNTAGRTDTSDIALWKPNKIGNIPKRKTEALRETVGALEK